MLNIYSLVLLLSLVLTLTGCYSTDSDFSLDEPIGDVVYKISKITEDIGKDTQKREIRSVNKADTVIQTMQANNMTLGVRVALLLPMTGKASKLGEAMFNAAQLAVFDKGISNIALVPYDTKGSSFGSLEAIKQAYNDGINIVVGPLFSSSSKAIADYASLHNMVVLSLSNDIDLADKGIFLMGFMPSQEIDKIISYAYANNMYSIAAILPNDSYGATIGKSIRDSTSKKDAQIAKIEFYRTGSGDDNISEKVRKVANSYVLPQSVYDEYEREKYVARLIGNSEKIKFNPKEEDKTYPHLIFLPLNSKEFSRILVLLDEYITDDREYKIVGIGRWSSDADLLDNKEMWGAWLASPVPKAYYEKFVPSYRAMYKIDSIRVSSIAYDAISAISLVAMENNGAVNSSGLLRHGKFVGIDGAFRFLPNGIVERHYAVLEIVHDGIKVIDFPNDIMLNY